MCVGFLPLQALAGNVGRLWCRARPGQGAEGAEDLLADQGGLGPGEPESIVQTGDAVGAELLGPWHIPPPRPPLGAPYLVQLGQGREHVCGGSSCKFLGAWLALQFPFLYGGNTSFYPVNFPCGVRLSAGVPGQRIWSPPPPMLRVSPQLGRLLHPYNLLTLNVASLWLFLMLPEVHGNGRVRRGASVAAGREEQSVSAASFPRVRAGPLVWVGVLVRVPCRTWPQGCLAVAYRARPEG